MYTPALLDPVRSLYIRRSFVCSSAMFQTIGEPIIVAGVYKSHTFIPKKFLWAKKAYSIDAITLISDTKDGMVRKRIYSVTVAKTLYRLLFNRETEQWTLEEMWIE